MCALGTAPGTTSVCVHQQHFGLRCVARDDYTCLSRKTKVQISPGVTFAASRGSSCKNKSQRHPRVLGYSQPWLPYDFFLGERGSGVWRGGGEERGGWNCLCPRAPGCAQFGCGERRLRRWLLPPVMCSKARVPLLGAAPAVSQRPGQPHKTTGVCRKLAPKPATRARFPPAPSPLFLPYV